MNKQSSWAIRNGFWVNIDEVESGIECNCICPICGSKMVAKKGDIKEHHFAHYVSSNCVYSSETALHMMAKGIIKKSDYIKLPSVHIDDIGISMNRPEKSILYRETKLKIDSVILEKRLHVNDSKYIIPDIIIEVKEKRLIIEIMVTHEVDSVKRYYIREMNIPAIEIDLSDVVNTSYNRLRSYIIDKVENKNWIYNNKANEIMKNIKIKTFQGKYNYSSVRCKQTNRIKSSISCYTDSCPYYCGSDQDGGLYCSYPKRINLK